MIVPKTPESHPWISLGSEQEIEEESVTESRPRVREAFSADIMSSSCCVWALAHLCLSVCLSSSGIRSLLWCGTVALRCVSLTAALWMGRTDTWSARHTRIRASASDRWRDTRPFRPPATPNTRPLRHCGTNTSRRSQCLSFLSFEWCTQRWSCVTGSTQRTCAPSTNPESSVLRRKNITCDQKTWRTSSHL